MRQFKAANPLGPLKKVVLKTITRMMCVGRRNVLSVASTHLFGRPFRDWAVPEASSQCCSWRGRRHSYLSIQGILPNMTFVLHCVPRCTRVQSLALKLACTAVTRKGTRSLLVHSNKFWNLKHNFIA
jgi:hypothetical protein